VMDPCLAFFDEGVIARHEDLRREPRLCDDVG
jgi:hypothetical protein